MNLYAWTTSSTSLTNQTTVYTDTESPTTSSIIYDKDGNKISGVSSEIWIIQDACTVYINSASTSALEVYAINPI